MQTAIRRVHRMGSAKTGVEAFKALRLTAIANAVLILWFIVQGITMSGAGYAEWVAWFASPYHAAMMALLVISSFYHARLGVQEIIEDYVHHEGAKMASTVALVLLSYGLMGACLVSIIMIAVGG